MKEILEKWIKGFYTTQLDGFNEQLYNDQIYLWIIGLIFSTLIFSALFWFVSRTIILQIVHNFASKSKATWDDHLMNNRVFRGLAFLVPLILLGYLLEIALFAYPSASVYTYRFAEILLLLASMTILNRFLNALCDIISDVEAYKDKPIKSFTQVIKIIFSGVIVILILAVLSGKSPVFFLTSLGAVSAVLLLVFKDTILGFVGSIQLSTNDMIRKGDWVTMQKYGADGDVEEINLTTVKVRNFDRTISTIPTYAFISDSFINWRGMMESNGRRIKRAVHLQLDFVRFASPELITKLSSINVLAEFISIKQQEINSYNESNGFTGDKVISGRQQTNLGLFRKYLEFYLKNNPSINEKMTLMVRQLPPSEKGIPIEVYCFTKTKEWVDYENVMADVFDHIFAVISFFDLKCFENPTGADIKSLGNKI